MCTPKLNARVRQLHDLETNKLSWSCEDALRAANVHERCAGLRCGSFACLPAPISKHAYSATQDSLNQPTKATE